LTLSERLGIFEHDPRKGESVAKYENDLEVPERVEKYLLKTVVNTLPREVVETLISMDQKELNALERLGKALKADKSHHCSCQQNYLFSVH
jgi:hypothetical protein